MPTSERNRIQKVLETANVKMRSVLADVFGVSGQQILEALLDGSALPEQMAQMVHGRAKAKIPALIESLTGHRMSEHHRWMIRQSLEHLAFLEQHLIALDERILQHIEPSGYKPVMTLLESVPGIQTDSAARILAEMGADIAVSNTGTVKFLGWSLSWQLPECWSLSLGTHSWWQSMAAKRSCRERLGRGGPQARPTTSEVLALGWPRREEEGAHCSRPQPSRHHPSSAPDTQPYAGEDAPLSEARRNHLIRQHIRKLGNLGVAVRARSSALYSAG